MDLDRLDSQAESLGLVPQLDGTWRDEADEIVVVITPAGAFVGWADVIWPGPGSPQVQLKGITHVPPVEYPDNTLERAVRQARSRRSAALRHCRCCGERSIPGHMASKDVCQACAERELGVAY